MWSNEQLKAYYGSEWHGINCTCCPPLALDLRKKPGLYINFDEICYDYRTPAQCQNRYRENYDKIFGKKDG